MHSITRSAAAVVVASIAAVLFSTALAQPKPCDPPDSKPNAAQGCAAGKKPVLVVEQKTPIQLVKYSSHGHSTLCIEGQLSVVAVNPLPSPTVLLNVGQLGLVFTDSKSGAVSHIIQPDMCSVLTSDVPPDNFNLVLPASGRKVITVSVTACLDEGSSFPRQGSYSVYLRLPQVALPGLVPKTSKPAALGLEACRSRLKDESWWSSAARSSPFQVHIGAPSSQSLP